MYSQSLFSANPVNDDVTVLENILSQGHGSNNFNYNWNNDLYPEQNQNYQVYYNNQTIFLLLTLKI